MNWRDELHRLNEANPKTDMWARAKQRHECGPVETAESVASTIVKCDFHPAV